jgi:hypothetical protein
MNAKVDLAAAMAVLTKNIWNWPAIAATGDSIQIRSGVIFNGRSIGDVVVGAPAGGFVAGTDYAVHVPQEGALVIAPLAALPLAADILGGFHFAPGSNAGARSGGDAVPAINPASIWDIAFRPTCPDPRGMAHVTGTGISPFWADIYLLAAEHLAGTSRFGVTIADGDDPPQKADGRGGAYDRLDYATAEAVLAHHGKQMLSYDEFRAAATGVTERTAAGNDPVKTGLDAPRTSRFGLMQATGNLWQWGHDGDPDGPRASIFGGSWWYGAVAGSRHAYLAYPWPEYSDEGWGARGRSDHLQPA